MSDLFDPKDYYGNDWPRKFCGPDCTCIDCHESRSVEEESNSGNCWPRWWDVFPDIFEIDRHGKLVIKQEVLDSATLLCDTCCDPECDGCESTVL